MAIAPFIGKTAKWQLHTHTFYSLWKQLLCWIDYGPLLQMSVEQEASFCVKYLLRHSQSRSPSSKSKIFGRATIKAAQAPRAEPLAANWASRGAQALESQEGLSFFCSGERKLFIWDLLTSLPQSGLSAPTILLSSIRLVLALLNGTVVLVIGLWSLSLTWSPTKYNKVDLSLARSILAAGRRKVDSKTSPLRKP